MDKEVLQGFLSGDVSRILTSADAINKSIITHREEIAELYPYLAKIREATNELDYTF